MNNAALLVHRFFVPNANFLDVSLISLGGNYVGTVFTIERERPAKQGWAGMGGGREAPRIAVNEPQKTGARSTRTLSAAKTN
jgi:hypothetical protein